MQLLKFYAIRRTVKSERNISAIRVESNEMRIKFHSDILSNPTKFKRNPHAIQQILEIVKK